MSDSYAIVAGVAGTRPDVKLRGALTDIAQTLRERLARAHRAAVQPAATLNARDLRVALKPLSTVEGGAWVVLMGTVNHDPEFDELTFQTADPIGLDVRRVAASVRTSPAPWRVVVIDVPEAHAAAVAALDWGPCAARAIGPGVAQKLSAALLPERSGKVLAGAVAQALGGTSDAPDVVLNRRTANAPKADPDAAARTAYLHDLQAICNRHALDVAPDEGGTGCGLADIYEPLHTHAADDPKPGKRQGLRPDPEEPKTAHDRLTERKHRRMFLVGDPGTGKTSFLHRIAADACRAALDPTQHAPPRGLPQNALPVVFELRHFKGEPSAQAVFEQAVANRDGAGGGPLPAALIQRARESGELVLLFDGLDEVVGDDADHRVRRRRQIAQAIDTLAAGMARLCVVILTCRPAAAQTGGRPRSFSQVTLQPMTPDQIGRVATRWMTVRDVQDAAALSARMVADLQVHAAVYQLARTPLTLAMICLVLYREPTGRLPRDRNALYSKLINLLLEDRYRDPSKGVSAQDRRMWITDLALHWWNTGGNVDPDAVLSSTAGEALLVKERKLTSERAREVVRFFDLRAALLVWKHERDNGVRDYRFAHRSFAEFLVACRMAESEEAARPLFKNAYDANWRHVVRMYVAEHTRQRMVKAPAWSLLDSLLGRANDPDQPMATRAYAARLVAASITEWRDQAHAEVPERITTQLDTLQTDLFLKQAEHIEANERILFWDAVERHNVVVATQSRWVPVEAGAYWRGAAPGDADAFDDETPSMPVVLSRFEIMRWPVTVAEFSAFWQAGGYSNQAFWSNAGWAWRTQSQVEQPNRWPLPAQWHHPITGVSFWEAQAWCAWASAQSEWAGEACRILLPSEAQWAAAARGPYDPRLPILRYPWGVDDLPDNRNGYPHLSQVSAPGAFPKGVSPTGTWDQSGNVWEWCRDAFADYRPATGPDPVRLPATANDRRVLRGGAFNFDPLLLRVSYRFASPPHVRIDGVGFRCVRVCPETP